MLVPYEYLIQFDVKQTSRFELNEVKLLKQTFESEAKLKSWG